MIKEAVMFDPQNTLGYHGYYCDLLGRLWKTELTIPFPYFLTPLHMPLVTEGIRPCRIMFARWLMMGLKGLR